MVDGTGSRFVNEVNPRRTKTGSGTTAERQPSQRTELRSHSQLSSMTAVVQAGPVSVVRHALSALAAGHAAERASGRCGD
jgi:hypothetical protein